MGLTATPTLCRCRRALSLEAHEWASGIYRRKERAARRDAPGFARCSQALWQNSRFIKGPLRDGVGILSSSRATGDLDTYAFLKAGISRESSQNCWLWKRRPDVVVVEEVPVPSPGPAKFLMLRVMAMAAARALGRDHPCRQEQGQPATSAHPPVLDLSGVVEKVGPGVTDFALAADGSLYGRHLEPTVLCGAQAEFAM